MEIPLEKQAEHFDFDLFNNMEKQRNASIFFTNNQTHVFTSTYI